jgi:hypothetical protein
MWLTEIFGCLKRKMDEEDPFYEDHDDDDLQPETKHSTKKKAGRLDSFFLLRL